MTTRIPSPWLVALLLAVAASGAARAGNLDQQKQLTWSLMDRCQKEAYAKFPDQTAAGEEQRRIYAKHCQIARQQNSSSLLLHN